MGKDFVLTSMEFGRIPNNLRKILRKMKGIESEKRATMIQAYIGVPIAADEINYKFDTLVAILKARARVYCPFCQNRIFRKLILEEGVKKVKNCCRCNGKGSLTVVEIERIKQELKERR